MKIDNILLDGFPTEYKGYAIRTDFRIGIMLSLLLEDETESDEDKYLQAFNLLYKDEVPDFETAVDGLNWFLSCGKDNIITLDEQGNQYFEEVSKDKGIDFNVDQLDIWGGFWSKGIDLSEEKMHWFKFMSALGNLGDCPITNKMSYRTMDLSKMDKGSKEAYSKVKNKVKIRPIIQVESKRAFEEEIYESDLQRYGRYYADTQRRLRQAQR